MLSRNPLKLSFFKVAGDCPLELKHSCTLTIAFDCSALLTHLRISAWQSFRSTLTLTDDQLTMAPDLEPAFENLLRTLNVDESLIKALRIT